MSAEQYNVYGMDMECPCLWSGHILQLITMAWPGSFLNRVVLEGEGKQKVFFPFDFAIVYKLTITKGRVHKEQITKLKVPCTF